jgi:hypothetical protein
VLLLFLLLVVLVLVLVLVVLLLLVLVLPLHVVPIGRRPQEFIAPPSTRGPVYHIADEVAENPFQESLDNVHDQEFGGFGQKPTEPKQESLFMELV